MQKQLAKTSDWNLTAGIAYRILIIFLLIKTVPSKLLTHTLINFVCVDVLNWSDLLKKKRQHFKHQRR